MALHTSIQAGRSMSKSVSLWNLERYSGICISVGCVCVYAYLVCDVCKTHRSEGETPKLGSGVFAVGPTLSCDLARPGKTPSKLLATGASSIL